MMILVHASPVSLLRDHGRPENLGVLISPRGCGNFPQLADWKWAADNDAYLAWDESRFVTMLQRIEGIPGCLFVSAPDVVGDASATLARFWDWHQDILYAGQPIALVAQDGIENTVIPWDDIDCLFIGGTTEFKMGAQAAIVAREARRRGKWLHMGRVNTRKRIRYAKSLGCDSIDGTNFSMFRRTNLPWALTWASSEQLWSAADSSPTTEREADPCPRKQ